MYHINTYLQIKRHSLTRLQDAFHRAFIYIQKHNTTHQQKNKSQRKSASNLIFSQIPLYRTVSSCILFGVKDNVQEEKRKPKAMKIYIIYKQFSFIVEVRYNEMSLMPSQIHNHTIKHQTVCVKHHLSVLQFASASQFVAQQAVWL